MKLQETYSLQSGNFSSGLVHILRFRACGFHPQMEEFRYCSSYRTQVCNLSSFLGEATLTGNETFLRHHHNTGDILPLRSLA